jgi:hypothetical protein
MRRPTDDDFNPDGTLKDKRSFRTPLMMADSNNARRRTLDAAAFRPGFRTAAAVDASIDDDAFADALDARDQAYRDYDERVSSAWLDSADDTFDKTMRVLARWQDAMDAETNEGGVEGDACTVRNAEFPDDQGSPGHIRMYRGRLVCTPDEPKSKDAATIDAREAAYQQYDREIADAWRTAR